MEKAKQIVKTTFHALDDKKAEDIKINEQLGYTVAYTSYNSSAIIRLGEHIHNMSYNCNNLSYSISNLATYTSYLSSYTNAAFAKNDEIDKKQQEDISANNQLNSYQQINIEKLTDVQINPWEIAK